MTTEYHQRLREVLERISSSFGRSISVLEAGCGSGRYFYCLKNVGQLVGLDLSPEMLEAARNPVRQSEISAREIRLVCGSVYEAAFPPGSFDFIFSLGMFGFGCRLSVELCSRFYDWLAPGGQLFFDALDRSGLSRKFRARRAAGRMVYRLLPRRLQATLDARNDTVPIFDLSRADLERILRASRFRQFAVGPPLGLSPYWETVRLHCFATKPANGAE